MWTSDELNHYLDFPHVGQVFRIERIVTDLHRRNERREVSYGITSLTPRRARPARVLELNRGHWCIENRVHWVRDVTFDEDRCRVRKNAAAQVMASLRNLAISLLRLAGVCNIAWAMRHLAHNSAKALRLIGLYALVGRAPRVLPTTLVGCGHGAGTDRPQNPQNRHFPVARAPDPLPTAPHSSLSPRPRSSDRSGSATLT
ncbi:MAG: ISAs1 family transposase [Planctomycetota bacterium]